jgi:hypothetical protein
MQNFGNQIEGVMVSRTRPRPAPSQYVSTMLKGLQL